ncbi:MAG: asparagine synthase (glutamine-hydrolyzing) [Burkholderiaceae bacterium]|jgi:asparagine synthase (glutamine-hydrolysing)|nr:asparagine synthase (glutamine-hydrolyzing) [Burkholderiaceae bacterium]MEB2352516.1 asparagine synthase (glutamine-hydrolyzing) [Burkholderiaceae bacterium]
MCGITGFLGFPPAQAAGDVLRSMAAAIAHRGPDDEGYWLDAEHEVALGHRRLSIVDLSQNGHQPMASADGRFVIALNGEIYDFMEVRAELEAAGAAPAWRGHSDTEVMLAAISAWGIERALQRFTGMFALALWDRAARALLLARDRIGEKPLYYGWAGDAFFFASELKSLRRWPGWHPEIDRGSIALLMRHNYVPAPYSIYSSVFKLEPGSYVSVTLGDARRGPGPGREPLPIRRYWSFRDTVRSATGNRFRGTDREAADQLESLLRASIRRQMIADVPLGAFLSGGIDSSTVVALMQSQSSVPIRTFTIGFNEDAYDEAAHARAVAKHLGTDHTEHYVTPAEAMSVIPQLPALYDEPFADSSQIPTHLVSRIARSQVAVCLSGDAGDELFGGYNRYFIGRRIWDRIGWIPGGLRSRASRLLTALPPERWDRVFARLGPLLPRVARQRNAGDKLHKLAAILGVAGPEDFYRALVSHWRSPAAMVPGSREPETILALPAQWPSLDDFTERMMFLDSVTYLPDDILVKVDRAAMGVSLETRVPFLDHAIIEFTWRLPLAMKLREGGGKWLLRQVLYRHVPKELIERPKMGFGVPIDGWLRGPMRDWAEALLDERRLRDEGWFDPAPIRSVWAEHLSGRRNWQYHLWDVLMFQAWLEHSHEPGAKSAAAGAAVSARRSCPLRSGGYA